VLWRPVVRNAARPSSSATTEVEAPPPPAQPAVPAPATLEASPTGAAPPPAASKSAEPAEGRGRAARNNITAKTSKSRKVGKPSDKTKNNSERQAGHGPRTGRW
ncbi:MAG: hypothetical protein WCG85_04335, partial [Polyangia bacterium]